MDQNPRKTRRLLLDEELRTILREALNQTAGKENIYFQPPESVKMKYDCIRYSENTMNVRRADNKAYLTQSEYNVIVITRDPDSPVPRMILERFQQCRPGRQYTADNLYHYPFTIIY